VSEDKKKKRISAEDYWKLQGLATNLRDEQKKFEDWKVEQAKALSRYLDEVNFSAGSILRPDPAEPAKLVPTGDHIPAAEPKAH
jgi:phage-related protein